MKFRFRLEKVLEHRERLEDEAQRNFMVAKAATAAALKELEGFYQSIDDARAGALNGQARELQQADLFIAGQKIRIERQRVKIRELKAHEEHLQELLVEAAREKKTLVKLREKALQAFREEVERLERVEADELAVMRYKRDEGL